MRDDDTVSQWIQQLRGGPHEEAAHKLWERCAPRLLGLARKQIRGVTLNLPFDENDVALSAYRTFCEGIQQGKYDNIEHREDLWALLTVITVRKSNDYLKRERAAKRHDPQAPLLRDVGRVQKVISPVLPPDLAIMMVERCRALLDELPDPEMRWVVLLKLDGYSHEEIAGVLGLSRRTIQRMVKIIQDLWSRHVDDQ